MADKAASTPVGQLHELPNEASQSPPELPIGSGMENVSTACDEDGSSSSLETEADTDTGVDTEAGSEVDTEAGTEVESTDDKASVSPEEILSRREENIPWDTGLTQQQKTSIENLVQVKLSMISPVLFKTHVETSDKAYLKRVAERRFSTPDGMELQYSVQTLERMVREYRKNGIKSLYPRRRSDYGQTRVLSFEVQTRIIVILQALPKADAVSIRGRLIKEKLLPEDGASADSIRRFINGNHLRALLDPQQEIELRLAFLEREIGFLWAADTCYLTKIPDEHGIYKWVYLIGIIDDHSRLIVAAKCFMADNSYTFQLTLRSAIENFYIPVKLYVDNGSGYSSKETIGICNNLGITLIHTRARDGAAKGVIERVFRACEVPIVLDLVLDNVDTLEGVQSAVDEWVEKYNHRVNRGVNAKPWDRHLASLKRHPVKRARSSEWLSEAFSYRVQRRISNTGTIQQNNLDFRIPDCILKQKPRPKTIEVIYDPVNLVSTIHVFQKGHRYNLLLDDREANAGKKREHGGRKEQLRQQNEARKAKKVSTAEARAEARFAKRMSGSPILEEIENAMNAVQKDMQADLSAEAQASPAADSELNPQCADASVSGNPSSNEDSLSDNKDNPSSFEPMDAEVVVDWTALASAASDMDPTERTAILPDYEVTEDL